jgi:uncharacterized protein
MPSIEQARSWYPQDDTVHNFDHVLRVYRMAVRLARIEGADVEIVEAAALLHDAQGSNGEHDSNQRADHHLASADFAAVVLRSEGWPDERIAAVQHAIRAHRFRDATEPPQTIEAKVLFDADKLDAIGAIGVARSIAYAAQGGQPIYTQPSDRFIETGEREPGEAHSSYHEFIFKLSKLKDRLYTPSARAVAEERHRFMVEFYRRLGEEMRGEDGVIR